MPPLTMDWNHFRRGWFVEDGRAGTYDQSVILLGGGYFAYSVFTPGEIVSQFFA